ncbi:LysR substrate-binding domain protein [Bordetella holmesii CDC-H635-BH]|uniref:LysR substrate-binding domain protein n=1 Tax=Bordetella holmesii CDC-H585-BH TaxID=1331206 RepID=A0A158M7I6_9BORD|nr:bacterial regulatory helix-turn-helix, lysR family protein [Bordetella holmesii 44057]AMD47485.1 LysR family transcriptional regulator [Bordetella holmesii F627]EWM41291.1 bacterial regulatory helix-turn-helix, lysR family protein [Bordetella holmesii 35009]KAK71209.1 LysR substrate-binding domain protein [Bordetella holmesii H620]KAK80278.1 LysR substrate-binding domain protein [Bordetella holmesii CDC-H809-BH]KAK82861.1 LysR substrate-binding domain protein [Bordetella holmesii CDC-H572-B
MIPDLRTLVLFIDTVEAGSITRAAKASNMVVSAASRRLALLEESVGTPLLIRGARGVAATPAGEAMLFHARSLLRQVGQMNLDLQDHARGMRGIVRIYAVASALSRQLPTDLRRYSELYPEVGVQLEEKHSFEAVAAVQLGLADVAVTFSTASEDDGLTYLPYKTSQLVAIVDLSHGAAHDACSLSDLLDYDLIGLESNTALMALLEREARSLEKTVRLRTQVKSFYVLARLVEARLGVGFMPLDAATSFAKDMQIRIIHLTDSWAIRQLHLCVQTVPLLPAHTANLVEVLGSYREQPSGV